MAERTYKAIVDKLKADQQAEIDLESAKLAEIEGLGPAIEADILAAENAILDSTGHANGNDKIYSDKEWNDRELEFKTAMEEKDTELADLGKQLVDAETLASEAKTEATASANRLAQAKAKYASQQEAETASESADAIFGEDAEPVSPEPTEQN